MKKLLFFAAIFFSVLSLKPAYAQLSISVNIGSQPTWGPTGYDHVDYYYLPDIDCYYYVPGHEFVYLSGARWIWSASLPTQYHNYDLYSGYKVVVNSPKPYLHNTVYRAKYAGYKGKRGQAVIRDSHDAKYKRPVSRPANIRTQAKANNHRPVAKPQPKHTVAKRPAAKPQPKRTGNKRPDNKDHKDDHHQ